MTRELLAGLGVALFCSVPTLKLVAAERPLLRNSTVHDSGSAGAKVHGRTLKVDNAPRFAPDRAFRRPHQPHTPTLIPDGILRDPEVSVSVQQTQPTVPSEAAKPAQKRFYVPPRWVTTETGVEVLMPGFWTDDPKMAGMEKTRAPQKILPEY